MTDAPLPPADRAPGDVHRDGRRELAYAVLGCLAGAGLALFAGTRAWVIEETARLAPLPSVTRTSSGGDLVPWLTPLALVGLAGAGALLATRGAARMVIGVLISCCGGGLLAGAAYGGLTATSLGWPVLAGLGGAVLAVGGLAAVLRGRRWPAMGARYERRLTDWRAGTRGPAGGSGPAGGEAVGGGGAAIGGVAVGGVAHGAPASGAVHDGPASGSGTVRAWDALDRGEDPTEG